MKKFTEFYAEMKDMAHNAGTSKMGMKQSPMPDESDDAGMDMSSKSATAKVKDNKKKNEKDFDAMGAGKPDVPVAGK